jgi:hypothetical protein
MHSDILQNKYINLAKTNQFSVVQFIEFCLFLTEMNVLKKKQLYQINKCLHELTNISNKKEKSIRIWMQSH